MHNLVGYLNNWAKEQPEARAIEFQDESITYGELHRQSSALSAALIDMGVSPGARVGIWLRKSIEAIVAVYGVLKAGAAYVPIDPSAPRGRAHRIISDCEVACVITHDDQVDSLLKDPGVAVLSFLVVSVGANRDIAADGKVLAWDEVLGSTSLRSGTSAPEVDTHALAYVLYTSGSQGVPKGVMLSHGNARTFVDWSVKEFGLRSTDRISSHAPLHFDLSVLDVFATCHAGGCLVLIPESQAGLGGVLNKLVVDRQISVWYSVPNALARMVTAKNSSLLAASSLRVVLFAGETFAINHVRRLHELLPLANLYNLYGPTETNVCTFHQVRITDIAPHRLEPLPIGRACPYAETFIVDHTGRPLEHKPGQSGELCVAGDSRMVGYWRDASLSATKTALIPQDDGESLEAYRTGDLVRLDDDLNYVFCGREDDMVKIRGNRVDLGEIESVLSSAQNVREVACVAVGDRTGEKHIEAYIVQEVHSCDISLLRRHCLASLPRYMVPEKFHIVTKLPLTSTGKIDRRTLSNSWK